MSQKKVDAYKQQKANRQKIIKKEKRILMLEKLAALVICIAAVCWVGYSVYGKITADKEEVVVDTALDVSALQDYVSNLNAEDTEEAVVTDVEEAAEDDAAEDETSDAAEEDAAEDETAEAAEEDAAEDESAEAAEDDAAEDETADAAEDDAAEDEAAEAAEEAAAEDEAADAAEAEPTKAAGK